MSYSVKLYKNNRGEEPVRRFIFIQNSQTQAKYVRMRRLLQDYGPHLAYPHAKHVVGNLFELRIKGQTEIRVFYAWIGNSYFLLHAFKKKSQKTPRQEIEKALTFLTRIYHM